MGKPNAEQFARIVLWHLAALRADVATLQAQTLRGFERDVGSPLPPELRAEWQEWTRKIREKLYVESLKEAEITFQPPFPPSTDIWKD